MMMIALSFPLKYFFIIVCNITIMSFFVNYLNNPSSRLYVFVLLFYWEGQFRHSHKKYITGMKTSHKTITALHFLFLKYSIAEPMEPWEMLCLYIFLYDFYTINLKRRRFAWKIQNDVVLLILLRFSFK